MPIWECYSLRRAFSFCKVLICVHSDQLRHRHMGVFSISRRSGIAYPPVSRLSTSEGIPYDCYEPGTSRQALAAGLHHPLLPAEHFRRSLGTYRYDIDIQTLMHRVFGHKFLVGGSRAGAYQTLSYRKNDMALT